MDVVDVLVGEVFDVDLAFDDKCVEPLPIVLAPLLRLGDLNQRWHWGGGAFLCVVDELLFLVMRRSLATQKDLKM